MHRTQMTCMFGVDFPVYGSNPPKKKVIWVQPYQLTLAMNLGDRDATPPNGCLGLHHLGCHWQVKAYRDPLLKMLHIFFAITVSRRPATRNVCTFVCVTSHPGFLRMFARQFWEMFFGLLDNSSGWEPTLKTLRWFRGSNIPVYPTVFWVPWSDGSWIASIIDWGMKIKDDGGLKNGES